MESRTTRALGATAAAGAVLSVFTAVPSGWYGVRETDAFLFDPAPLSPLWVERTVVPLAGLLAGLLVFAGLVGLVARDRDVAGRLRRWGGYVAVAGMALLEAAMLAFAVGMGASRGGSELVAVLLLLGGLLVGLVAVGLLVPGLVAAGVGYVRADRPTVGYALAVGGGVSALVTVVSSVADLGVGFGTLPMVLPSAAAFVAVGHELWTHPDPVPEVGDEGDAVPGRAGSERTSVPDAPADDERGDDGGSDPVDPGDVGPPGDGDGDDDGTG